MLNLLSIIAAANLFSLQGNPTFEPQIENVQPINVRFYAPTQDFRRLKLYGNWLAILNRIA